METPLILSPLAHTWLIDIDGTLFQHNGHLIGPDVLLPGVCEFWAQIPEHDTIVLLSARKESEAAGTLANLRHHRLRHDHAIFGLPTGERVLINDRKPSGLNTAIAVNTERNEGLIHVAFSIDPSL